MAYLEGTAGDDSLVGTDGDDEFIFSGGNDTIIGGAGFDRVNGQTDASVTIDLALDFIETPDYRTLIEGIENVELNGTTNGSFAAMMRTRILSSSMLVAFWWRAAGGMISLRQLVKM